MNDKDYSTLSIYIAKTEYPSEDEDDWELQGTFDDFREAILHAADIERHSKTPVIIMDIGSIHIRGQYRHNQPMLCWWSENYVPHMERPSPTERGFGWHYNHGYQAYEFVEKPTPVAPMQVDQTASVAPVITYQSDDRTIVPFATKRIKDGHLLPIRIHLSLMYLLWFFFILPGRASLWLDYMYPKRGQVYASGRRLKSDVAAVIASISIYISLAFLIFVIIDIATHQRSN